MQTTELYFDGTFAAPRAGGSLQAINPATETVFARIAAVETRDNGKPVPQSECGVGEAGFMGFREIKQITRCDHTRTWDWYLRP